MPVNRNMIMHYDFETNNINPYNCQPIEIAAVMIDPRNLEIIPDSMFYSLIKPVSDDICESVGLAKTSQEALDVNKKTLKQLETAPALKSVWLSFCEYVSNYNPSGKSWNGPILSGFNNQGFDDIILNRIAEQYGPFDKERKTCSLFHPIHNIDLMRLLFPWFESNAELTKFKMDSLREYFGISMENAHHAKVDVLDQSKILIQLLKLTRRYSKITNWKK